MEDWHAWGSVIVGDKRKKLIIFDYDPNCFEPEYTPRIRELGLMKQRDWVAYARERTTSIDEIWYIQNAIEGGGDKCVAATMRWVQQISSKSNDELWNVKWADQGYIQMKL